MDVSGSWETCIKNEKLEGTLMPGELQLIPLQYKKVEEKLNPAKGLDVGAGKN